VNLRQQNSLTQRRSQPLILLTYCTGLYRCSQQQREVRLQGLGDLQAGLSEFEAAKLVLLRGDRSL
jgi:hypothetical protein